MYVCKKGSGELIIEILGQQAFQLIQVVEDT